MEQINLNLIPNGIPAVCHVSQYDNTGRKIRFRLFNGSDPYVLSDTETISLHIRKSNGEVLIFDIANASSDYIDLEIASEMSDVSGESICKFYIENSNINVGSFNFKMRVEPDAFDGKITTSEARGPIASFETNIEDNLIKLKSEINPLQDLHGYSKPWSGGGGKNKLDYLSNLRATSSGLTISATSGGAIHYQGTATVNYCQLTYIFNLSISSGTTVTVSRDVAVGHQHYFGFTFTDNSVEYVRIMPNTTSTTYTLPKDLKSIDIVCLGLAVGTAYNETVKFQLEYGSQATSWEPYSNICPISGFPDLNVTRTGKNFFNKATITPNQYINANGMPQASTGWSASAYISVKPNTNYYLSGIRNSGSIAKHAFYKADKTLISVVDCPTYNITTPNDCYFIRLSLLSITPDNAQLELGNQATDFEPYNGQTATVNFGQTVYGGSLDVTNGKLTITHIKITDFAQYYRDFFSGTYSTEYRITLPYPSTNVVYTVKRGSLCNCKNEESAYWGGNHTAEANSANDIFAINPLGEILAIYDADTTLTKEQFEAKYSGNIEFVYELATPIEITTTPENLTAIVGQNNVYADTNGDTEVKYYIEV